MGTSTLVKEEHQPLNRLDARVRWRKGKTGGLAQPEVTSLQSSVRQTASETQQEKVTNQDCLLRL